MTSKQIHDGNADAPTLSLLARQLELAEVTSEQLVRQALDRALDLTGNPELRYVFTWLDADGALEAARGHDRDRSQSKHRSPWAGIPITVKDLFDLQGQVTTAGSKVLADSPPAAGNAVCIQRLIDAGFVILGKVNMTEFAYSGLGLNPHYGTPVNPYSAALPRIPGGSSCGAGVSVATGLVAASIGTDTGGSVRIPASLCNLVGFKPPAARVSADGVVPLSATLDSIGPLVNSVNCAVVLDRIMSGEWLPGNDDPEESALKEVTDALQDLKLLVPVAAAGADFSLWSDAQPPIGEQAEQVLSRLQTAGVQIVRQSVELFDDVLGSGVQGVIAGYESASWHRDLMTEGAQLYDPRVLIRLQGGDKVSEQDYRSALSQRNLFIDRFERLMEDYDAVVLPTTSIVAPTMAELAADDDYGLANQWVLRNTSVGNTLDAAAISLPMPLLPMIDEGIFDAAQRGKRLGNETGLGDGTASVSVQSQQQKPAADKVNLPAGFMLMQSGSRSNRLLSVAGLLEKLVCQQNL